jgi:hypothetical protein
MAVYHPSQQVSLSARNNPYWDENQDGDAPPPASNLDPAYNLPADFGQNGGDLVGRLLATWKAGEIASTESVRLRITEYIHSLNLINQYQEELEEENVANGNPPAAVEPPRLVAERSNLQNARVWLCIYLMYAIAVSEIRNFPKRKIMMYILEIMAVLGAINQPWTFRILLSLYVLSRRWKSMIALVMICCVIPYCFGLFMRLW